MRRSRISIKPNVRPGNRTATIGEQACEAVKEAGKPSPAGQDEEMARPVPSHQQTVEFNKPSENLSVTDVPGTPSGNYGAPSSGAPTSSAAPSRRMRILAAPKLGPKLTSTPRMQPRCQARMSNSAPAPILKEEHVQINNSSSQDQDSVSIISNELPESGSPRRSTSPPKLPTKSSETTNTSSPCIPSTSGLHKVAVHGKNSMEDSPPSPQPGQVPQQPSQEPVPQSCLSSSDLSSTCITPSQLDQTGSSEMTEKSLDKDRILRALKLKELMKIERRKDIQMMKRRFGHIEYTALDRSKMTMRDLIYYLPNTSPMRSSEEHEENQENTIIPPSPRQQIKTAEREDEDEEESDNGEMLVPKVRVAEDGSIILDEESLTVRVQRTSNTKVLEDSMFERGSTTTYASFRRNNYVKSWSVRETDLFFLAISMVGTDFTLIGQLLSHRSRVAIKNKFKKEERLNPWRVDKALRSKRPYDKEFFSFLQEKILEKDKDKRKSVKLILPKTKKPRKFKEKASDKICISDDDAANDDAFSVDDYGDLADDAAVLVEKENKDVSNVKEAESSVSAKKRRKRTRDVHKDKDNDDSPEKQVKRKRQRKCSKNTTEVNSKDDTEGVNKLSVEGETINLDKEDELERSASKRRRKSSKCSDEKQNEKPAKEKKGKQRKKSRKVVSDHEESVSHDEEGSIVDEDGSAIKKKRKRAKNSDLNGDVSGKERTNRKRKKTRTKEEEGTAEGEPSLDLQLNAPDTIQEADVVLPNTTRRCRKPNLSATRKKNSKKTEVAAEVETESQNDNNHESVLTAAGSPVQDERFQMQAVVMLEKTPPRELNSLSPSKVQCKNTDLEPSVSSNASSSESCSTQQTRKQRAGRVKRDLSTSGKLGSKERMIDQDEAESVSPMVLLEQIIQEPEDEEHDDSMNENQMDLSCLHGLDSHMFQRRPMVVLSREEVDMVLHSPDQSDEDPSVSPLDLSLNTELSFPFQCSKLMEGDDAEVEHCAYEERSNERASHEERTHEELELTESALAQPDISNISEIFSCLKPDVCSHPEASLSKVTTSCIMEEAEPQVHTMACKDGTTVATVLEGSPPLIVLDVHPICMNPDIPMAQETPNAETITLGTSLEVSNVMEESEKYVLPTLPNESAPASSEIAPQSKPAPIENELISQRSLQAVSELKEELQTSLEGQTSHDLSECKKGTQESILASPEVKVPENKKDFQEEVSVQTSSASCSSELCIRPPRRNRILKPKPNLSQKSRGPVLLSQRRDIKTHSTLEPKSSQPSVSTEKLIHIPSDQHDACEDICTQNLNKEVERSPSHAMESVADLGDSSTAVPDLQSVAALTLNPASTDDDQVASEFDVGNTPPCTSFTVPQHSQTREDPGKGQMIVSSEDVCAPAEIFHLTEEDHNGEEPTFILTLYEIPVTQTYPPSSSNNSAMTQDLPTVERIDSMAMEISGTEKVYLQNDSCAITKDLAENGRKRISTHATSDEIIPPQVKDEDSGTPAKLNMGSPPLDPQSDCDKSSEIAPFDLAHRIQSTPSGFSVSRCITTLPQDSWDTKQSDEAFHMVLDDVFVPVSDDTKNDSSSDGKTAIESTLQSKEASSLNVTEYFAVNAEDQTASGEHILLDKKDEESDACANLKIGILNMERNSECKSGSTSVPFEDVASRIQSIPSEFITSQCASKLLQDSVDTEQHEKVSHTVLGDVFVPVLEGTDDSCKDRTMAVECKREHKEGSLDSVSEDLAENFKEQISERITIQEPILVDTKDEDNAGVYIETGISHMVPHSEGKMGSEIDSVEASRTQSIPFRSECIETLPQDPIDTERCEKVSHLVLDDVFVPVSGERRDITSEVRMTAGENKLHSKEGWTFRLPERQDTPCEEVGDLSAVSNPLLCLDSREESNDTPQLSEKKKAPARRRERQIKPQPKLVKRAKTVSSKTKELVKETSLPTTSQDGNLPSISNTTDEKSVKSISSIEGNITSVSKGKEVKPKSTADESLKMSQGDLDPTESKPMSSALQLFREPKLEEESSENVIGETSAEDKRLSMTSHEKGAIVQPCCEDRNSSLMKASGSDSSSVTCEKTEAANVSHMLLPDIFVLVSDETETDLCSDYIESSLQKERAGDHFQKESQTDDAPMTLIGESTQLPLTDINSPVKKRGAASQQSTLPPNENMVLLEGELQRKHHIMPCSVQLSSIDTAAWSLKSPQHGVRNIDNDSTVMSSPNVTNTSDVSCTPVLSEEIKLKEPDLEKKSPSRGQGKKNESSTDTNSVQIISPTRQLIMTDWVKGKSHQTAANQEEKEPGKSLQMHTSLNVKDLHQLMVEKIPSKSENAEEPEGSHLALALDENKEAKRSSEIIKESTKDPSVSQVKKSPARCRAKLQVKPTLTKRPCVKSEGETSSDQPQPSRLTSPAPLHVRPANKKRESDNEAMQPVKEDSNTSSTKADSASGPRARISQDTWPRVVLPRVKLCTIEADMCSSSTPTSSPARVSQSAFPPVTPPQLKKSPTHNSSPTSSENPDDPSRVSQFFLCDIFTEVDE